MEFVSLVWLDTRPFQYEPGQEQEQLLPCHARPCQVQDAREGSGFSRRLFSRRHGLQSKSTRDQGGWCLACTARGRDGGMGELVMLRAKGPACLSYAGRVCSQHAGRAPLAIWRPRARGAPSLVQPSQVDHEFCHGDPSGRPAPERTAHRAESGESTNE